MNAYEKESEYFESKKVLMTSASFGLLRKELIENLGVQRAKGFLLRYGWHLGETNANEAMEDSKDFEELINQASILHLNTGQISNVISERKIEMTESNKLKYMYATGKWIDSVEAHEHLKTLGISDTPVCHTLTGFASGYMSKICERKMYVRETHCKAMGDKECCYEMRIEEEWDDSMHGEISSYNEPNIIDELKVSYEQLLEQRNYIEKLSKFHSVLTQMVSDGNDIFDITNRVFEVLGIPISIVDLSFHNKTFVGLTEEQYEVVTGDLKKSFLKLKKGNKELPLFKKTTVIQGAIHERLITPIIVQKKTIGYCTFIYMKNENSYVESDSMFLERAASAAGLYFLNEKTSFEALEKMKGYFLEQLLLKQYNSKSNVISQGYYIGINLEQPFYIATISCQTEPDGLLSVIEQRAVLTSIIKFLDIQDYKVLICQFEENVVLLLPETENYIENIERIGKHLKKSFQTYQFKIGVSNSADNIDKIQDSLEESQISLRMKSQDEICHYKDVGIMGTLINSKNINEIRKIGQQELKTIFELKAPRQVEILKTMYVFLSNGGNLQRSMTDLSLSMSGLMYRITKIEELIQKDLRDPIEGFQLLLILDGLKAIGDIDL